MNKIECEICKQGPQTDGRAVYRVNPKGVDGVWRCEQHMSGPIDPATKEITDIISKGYTDK